MDFLVILTQCNLRAAQIGRLYYYISRFLRKANIALCPKKGADQHVHLRVRERRYAEICDEVIRKSAPTCSKFAQSFHLCTYALHEKAV